MQNNYLFISVIAAILALASCKSSDEVMSNSFIQKRKYTSGYFVDKSPKREITKPDVDHTADCSKYLPDHSEPSLIIEEEKIISVDKPEITTVSADATEGKLMDRVMNLYSEKSTTLPEYMHKRREIKEEVKRSVHDKLHHSAAIFPSSLDTEKGKGGGFSIISLFCALAGLLFARVLFGILAIFFAGVGMGKGVNKGIAIAGLVIGVFDIATIFFVLFVI